jgi:hypothetical protein
MFADASEGFSVNLDPPEAVLDYSLTLTCRASKFLYQNSIEWMKNDINLSKGNLL